MPYTIALHRPRETWKDFVLTGEGIRLAFRAGHESGFAMLGRVFQWLGKPDAPLTIFTDRLDPHHLSLATLRDTPVNPCPASPETYTALCDPQNNLMPLIAREFVWPSGELTEAGIQAKAAYEQSLVTEEAGEKKVWLTPTQVEMFDIVLRTPIRFATLHGKTRNHSIREKWVELVDGQPRITELGRKIYEDFISRAKD
jgi:hypothetical protein